MFLANEQFSSLFQNFAPARNQFSSVFQNLLPANEQLAGTVKANVEKQVTLFAALSESAVDSIGKVAELNINACKASLEESRIVANQLLAVKAPQEAIELISALQQPTFAKFTAYHRHLADIASGAQTAFSAAINEQVKESTRQLTEMVDAASKNAPAGSENFVAIAKSAIANASAGYDQLNKTTRQAAEVVQANVAASVEQATQAAEQASAATRARK